MTFYQVPAPYLNAEVPPNALKDGRKVEKKFWNLDATRPVSPRGTFRS